MTRPGLIGLILLITLTGCSTGQQQTEVAAPNREQLCRALGKDPEQDPLCDPKSGPLGVLSDAFPAHVTTRQQVDTLIGMYRISSELRQTGGVLDVFVVQRTLLAPTIAIFTYSEDDKLISITIED